MRRGAASSSRSAAPGTLRMVLLLGSLEAFGPLSMDLYMPALPDLAQSLQTSDALAQATMSLCMIGLGLGQLVLGPLSDRYGRRPPLIAGIAGFSLMALICAFAPSIELLLVARLLQGFSASAGVVIALAIARDLYEGVELSRMLSLLTLVGASAPIIAPIIGGQLLRVVDWRGLFVVLAVIGALLLLSAALGIPTTHAAQHAEGFSASLQRFRDVLRDRVFVLLLLTAACTGVAFFSYLSMSTFVIQEEFGLSAQTFSLIFAMNGLANMTGAQASRAVVRRTGPERMYLIGMTCMAVAALTLLAVTAAGAGIGAFIAALCVVLFCAGVSGPNSQALALSRHAERAGTAAALVGSGTFVVGPIVAPLASAAGATALTMAITMGVAAGIGALSAWIFVRPALLAASAASESTAAEAQKDLRRRRG